MSRSTAVALTGALSVALAAAPPVAAAPDGNQVVINEVYSNGPGTSGPYLHDFIELYNPSDHTIPLDGMIVVVYGGVSGDAVGTVRLRGDLAAGDHHLLRLKESASAPARDAAEITDFDGEDADLRLPSRNGSVALAFGESTLDLVGFGTTERFEGKKAKAPRRGDSLQRTDAADTDDNAADFRAQRPTPQHSTGE